MLGPSRGLSFTSLMLSSHVPKHFLGEVVLIIIYLINKMSSYVLKFKTLCQTIFVTYLYTWIISTIPIKVFGCTSFVHKYQQRCSKVDPKALKWIFLVFFSNKKGYKCYSLVTRKFKFVDVTFFENELYYPKIVDVKFCKCMSCIKK